MDKSMLTAVAIGLASVLAAVASQETVNAYTTAAATEKMWADAHAPHARPSLVANSGALIVSPPAEVDCTIQANSIKSGALNVTVSEEGATLTINNSITKANWNLTLGPNNPAGWKSSQDGRTLKLQAENGDELSLHAVDDGVIRVDWSAPKAEQQTFAIKGIKGNCFGSGERFVGPNLKGRSWNVAPEDDVRTKNIFGNSYCAVPWFFSTENIGFYVDAEKVDFFDFTKWRIFKTNVKGNGCTFWLIAAKTPKEVLSSFTGIVGRSPLAPDWTYGVWANLNNGMENVEHNLEVMRRDRIPFSAAWIFDHKDKHDVPWIGWRMWSDGVYGAEPKKLTDLVKSYGMQPMCYFITNEWEKDFGDAEAVSEWGQWLNRILVEDGWDGFMEDTGDGQYNKNPMMSLMYHRTTHELSTQLNSNKVTFVRSGFSGSQAYSQVLWGGDQYPRWTKEGLESLIPAALSAGMSGFGVWAPDIMQCYHADLYRRWIEFGAFSCVMREHQWTFNAKAYHLFSTPDLTRFFKEYAQIHNSLFPYIRAMVQETHETGIPVMRHMVLEYPELYWSRDCHDQYSFGDRMIVAPVTKKHTLQRNILLPPGEWVNFWDTSKIIQGKGDEDQLVGAYKIPVYVRAGSILPMLPETMETLNESASKDYETPGDRLVVRVYPSTKDCSSTITLGDGTVLTSNQKGKDLTITVSNSPEEREYIIELPRAVSIHSLKVENSELLYQPQSGQEHSALLHIRGTNPTVKAVQISLPGTPVGSIKYI